MTDSSSARWYVVQTQVNSETKAALNLRRQGFEIYLPRHLKRRRHARKVEIAAKPLFPRYLFVTIDRTAQRWRSIQLLKRARTKATARWPLAVRPPTPCLASYM